MGFFKQAWIGAFAAGAFMLTVGEGAAYGKGSLDSTYSYKQTFGSALRLLKVELGYQVTEVSAEWGYLLFEFTSPDSGKRKNKGSVELIEGDGIVSLTIATPELPSYHEDMLVERLKRKLSDEHGTAPSRAKAKKAEDKSDAKDKKKSDADKQKGKSDGDSIKNPDTVEILEPERDTLKKKKSAD